MGFLLPSPQLLCYIAAMFKKTNRLSSGEFSTYFQSGKRHHSDSFELRYTSAEQLKVAVVVPKKVVKTAVGRNRLRRQLYHILRPLLKDKTGVYIVIAKKGATAVMSDVLKQDLETLTGQV